MKAVNYQSAFRVKVEDVPKPAIEHPDDVIVKVTTAAICGSDLHMYEGRTGAEPGITFGHENMGIVEELGDGVMLLKKGDRVVMPFNVADGRCRNCEEGRTAFCTGVNPGKHPSSVVSSTYPTWCSIMVCLSVDGPIPSIHVA